MTRIRTSRAARKLRPVAVERARQGKIREGDIVFYGDISWATVEVVMIFDHKPYRAALLRSVRSGGCFVGGLGWAYPSREEYEASGVHWRMGLPKARRPR